MSHSIGIDIGGTFIKCGLVDAEGTIVKRLSTPTPQKKEDFLAMLLSTIRKMQQIHPVLAIGISVPGTSDKNGRLLLAGALTDLYNYPLGENLQNKLKLPVYIENDANCAGLAEQWLGNGKKSDSFICMTLGTGVGGAIILNKQLYHGNSRNAGEFGLMLTNSFTYKKDALYDSLNLYGSVQNGLVRLYNSYSKKNPSESGKEIYERFQQQEIAAEKAVMDFLLSLSIGLLNITTVLDPELILIGGGISANQEFIADLNHIFDSVWNNHGHIRHRKRPTIKRCLLGNDAGILGAVSLIRKHNELPSLS